MWVPPKDTDPILLHAPTRKSVTIFGAVRLRDGHVVTQHASSFNADTFQGFLELLLLHSHPGLPLRVVTDNARYHHAKALRPWRDCHQHFLQLDFLPPYSPALNAMERVWKLTRRLCTHNQYYPQPEDLVDAVNSHCLLWAQPNEIIRRLCAIT